MIALLESQLLKNFHYNKDRLRQVDKRIRYLHVCIDELKVIDYHPSQEGKVMFGTWIEIENLQKGIKKKLRIVGSEELLGNSDYISMDSLWQNEKKHW